RAGRGSLPRRRARAACTLTARLYHSCRDLAAGRRLAVPIPPEETRMAEVLARYTDSLAIDGIYYIAQACGAPGDRGLWEGWLEFIALDDEHVLRTSRETTQPNRGHALYWASGLTRIYLEGALERAAHHVERLNTPPAEPIFTEPGPRR